MSQICSQNPDQVLHSRHRSCPALSLDLSCIPTFRSQQYAPSTTLLITGLDSISVFHPNSLYSIKSELASIASLETFSPLPSLQRIVCSFTSYEDSLKARDHLCKNGISVEPSSLPLTKQLGCRVVFYPKVYFGNTDSSQQCISTGSPGSVRSKFLGTPILERCSTPPPTPSLSPTTSDNASCDEDWSINTDSTRGLSRSDTDTSLLGNSLVDACPLKKHMRTRSMTIYSPVSDLDDPIPSKLPAVTVEDTTIPYDVEDGVDI